MLNGLDLFSGIGGLTIALAPWFRPITYCENDRYAQAVLLSRMARRELPVAPIWDDVQTIAGWQLQPHGVDAVWGGFPCQDISIAGARQGLEGKRSGLFFELVRIVGELRPRFVFLENVPAISTLGLDRVLLEFTALGYSTRWTTLSAGEIGAPHLRERWWLYAHADGEGFQIAGDQSDQKGKFREAPRNPVVSLVQRDLWKEPASKFCGMDDGIRPKTHRLRALGNAVVPAQAREAFIRLSGMKET